MNDVTSRRAAIDTEGLEDEIRCEMCRNPMHTNRGCDGNCKYDEKLYEKIMQILYERIKPLPSAQPEQSEITDEQAIAHLQSSGWMQNHDKEMYESGLKVRLNDDSGSYDSLIPCDDLISRQATIAEFSCCELTPDGGIDANYAIDFLKCMPSAQPEPCDDAVSREAVSEWLKQYGQDVLHGKYKFSLMYIWKNLMDLPSAQRTGKWINHRCDDGHHIADCNLCGHALQWHEPDDTPGYCCMCGARMELQE